MIKQYKDYKLFKLCSVRWHKEGLCSNDFIAKYLKLFKTLKVVRLFCLSDDANSTKTFKFRDFGRWWTVVSKIYT